MALSDKRDSSGGEKPARRKGDKFRSTSSSIELRLPSRLGYEKVAMNTAASVARLMGFSDERVDDLKTAVAEACINAMEHGNKLDESLSVGVVLSMDANSLEVKVTDNGEGPQGKTDAPNIDKKMPRGRRPRHGHVPHPGPGRRSRVGQLPTLGQLRPHGHPSRPPQRLAVP